MIKSMMRTAISSLFDRFGYSIYQKRKYPPYPPVIVKDGFNFIGGTQENKPPPNCIPEELYDRFTMSGKIPVLYSYINEAPHEYIYNNKHEVNGMNGGGIYP